MSLETFVLYKHGGPRHVRIDYVPDQRADGTVDGYNALVQDISERKLAEEEMRAASRRNEALAAEQAAILGQLAEGVIVTDPAGRITFVNDAAERLHGVARLDVPPQDYSDTYHLLTEEGQPYPPEELPLARAVLRDETVTEARWRIARPDGTEVIAVGSARPVLAPDGVKRGAVLTLRDDTARASAEKALLGLNARLEAEVAERTADRDRMWRSSQDLFVVLGGDGVFRAINPAWTAVLGYDAGQVVGQRFDRFVHPDDVERTFAVVARATGGLIRQFENRYRHRDGSYRWIAWTAEPHEGLIYGVGRDVTADKEQALALQQAEEALRQSQKMEAVGQLTGGIAHDFNNLLQGIIGSLDLVRTRVEQGRSGDIERFVEGAIASANRAAALTHRLLAFSRRQPLDPKPVDANELIGSMEDLLRRTMGETIRIELVLADDLWPTLCDPNQLETSILNLAINARDAMPAGGLMIIETRKADLHDAHAAGQGRVVPGQYVRVRVTDDGEGMPADVVSRAFDPFFTTKPLGQGTGLGLSMIYGFAHQSEGHAGIHSQPGHGTTVALHLPRHRGALQCQAIDTARVDDHEAEDGEVLLVVEDEPIVRTLIVEVLNELGYRVLEVGDGPGALEILDRAGRLDLLVTDIGLPGLNGRQVADAARLRRPDLKVLFMTGYAEDAVTAGGFLEPGMEMVTKPVSMDALVGRIRRMISPTRAQPSQASAPASASIAAADHPIGNSRLNDLGPTPYIVR